MLRLATAGVVVVSQRRLRNELSHPLAVYAAYLISLALFDSFPYPHFPSSSLRIRVKSHAKKRLAGAEVERFDSSWGP